MLILGVSSLRRPAGGDVSESGTNQTSRKMEGKHNKKRTMDIRNAAKRQLNDRCVFVEGLESENG